MGFHFLNNSIEFEYLKDSYEYDTISPANYCISTLKKINKRIKQGEIIVITRDEERFTKGRTDIINNEEDFKKWLREVYRGFENILDDN
ncbi:hypothetical protein [Zobellia laminariae]|uniref:hypothetical protein n=1 Tax=Zobellia laminariae TaxID=248906 RepID=UPI0026F42C2A|nr:hypothetical protein [Zobellia laminariae]WKX75879.1 hypothetical protein Q5W13_20155 [Zobellia laminariae]